METIASLQHHFISETFIFILWLSQVLSAVSRECFVFEYRCRTEARGATAILPPRSSAPYLVRPRGLSLRMPGRVWGLGRNKGTGAAEKGLAVPVGLARGAPQERRSLFLGYVVPEALGEV